MWKLLCLLDVRHEVMLYVDILDVMDGFGAFQSNFTASSMAKCSCNIGANMIEDLVFNCGHEQFMSGD